MTTSRSHAVRSILRRPRTVPHPIAAAARLLAVIAIAHACLPPAAAAQAPDAPPNLGFSWVEPVSGVSLYVRSEPGSRCWRGACADLGDTVTLVEPLTVTLGTTGTLFLTRNRDEAHRLTATWHRVDRTAGEAIDAITQRWRTLPPGKAVDLGTTGIATVTLPDEEGWWVLAVHAVWGDAARSAVSWDVLLNVIDGTGVQTFEGSYVGRFEASLFTPGPGRCPGNGGRWNLEATKASGFHARHRAIQAAVSGAPWDNGAYDFVVVTVRFRGLVEPLGAAGASWARGGWGRTYFITELLDMQPTLQCGADKADLLLAAARVDGDGCARGLARERIAVTVRNIGSRPSDPYDVRVRDTAGATVAAWAADRLAAGETATFETVRARRPADRDASVAVAVSADPFTERFPWSNNERPVERPAVRPTACPALPPAIAARTVWLPLAVRRLR